MTEEERLTDDARRVRKETRELREEGEEAAEKLAHRERERDRRGDDAGGSNPLAKTSSGDADSITDG
jgi:hypothetical protein